MAQIKFGLFFPQVAVDFRTVKARAQLADRVGFHSIWFVDHMWSRGLPDLDHLEAWTLMSATAAVTERIGVATLVLCNSYRNPALLAKMVSSLDNVSGGRFLLGLGAGWMDEEYRGYGYPFPSPRVRIEQLDEALTVMKLLFSEARANFEGKYYSVADAANNPKPVQKPHPPMWIACTNRETIKVAARHGLGALAFSFIDPDEAHAWVDIYYDIIKSDECVPLGHTVNANVALVTGFSLHEERAEAIRRGMEGFQFFGYALNALVAHDQRPGRTDLWGEFQQRRAPDSVDRTIAEAAALGDEYASCIGSPADARRHLRQMSEVGVDQVIFIQQAGRNRHDDICASLELFATDVLPEFAAVEPERQAHKRAELEPYVAAALARKQWMQPLAEEDIPTVHAAVARAQTGGHLA